jgi:hypothetical protein
MSPILRALEEGRSRVFRLKEEEERQKERKREREKERKTERNIMRVQSDGSTII